MAESNDLLVSGTGSRKRLHLGTDGETPTYVIWPDYTGVSSDPAVAVTGDGGDYRLAAIAVGLGECDLTITRASDGATASVHVTVLDVLPPDPLPSFTVHLGETF